MKWNFLSYLLTSLLVLLGIAKMLGVIILKTKEKEGNDGSDG